MIGKLVKTAFGGINLIFNGNRYTINRNDHLNQTATFWRCVKRKECKGTVNTVYVNPEITQEGEVEVKRIGIPHTHASREGEIAAEEVVRSIKRKATAHPNEPPLKIVMDEVARVSNEETLMRLPERRVLFRTISRQQNKQRPLLPRSLEEFVVQEPYKNTINGQNFLQLDSGPQDPARIIMFYTEDGKCISDKV